MQIFHELTIFEHENKKINGKIVFGRCFPVEIPDILCELKVSKDNYPRNIEKCLEVFQFIYGRYYKKHVWNSYEEMYLTAVMKLVCDFMDRRPGSDNQFMALLGPTNVGKTYRLTALYNWLYLMNPMETAIQLTSTTADSTRKRIWTDYIERFKEVKAVYPELYSDKLWKINDISFSEYISGGTYYLSSKIKRWFNLAKLADATEVGQRRTTCVGCPFNIPLDRSKEGFDLRLEIKDLMSKEFPEIQTTHSDEDMGVCGVCNCAIEYKSCLPDKDIADTLRKLPLNKKRLFPLGRTDVETDKREDGTPVVCWQMQNYLKYYK